MKLLRMKMCAEFTWAKNSAASADATLLLHLVAPKLALGMRH
jgi:hypothetical protein